MRKILLGLLALSTISLAANINLGDDPAENSNIFQTGQTGKIQVQATVKSDVPIVKYVIFANTMESLDGAEEVLTLSNFSLQAKVGEVPVNAGFTAENPTLYVRRLSDSNELEALQDSDKMTIRLVLPSATRTIQNENTVFPHTDAGMIPTSLLTAEIRKEVAEATGLILHEGGLWLSDSNNKAVGVKGVKFELPSNGTIKIQTGADTTTRYTSANGTITDDQDIVNKWNSYFAMQKEILLHFEVTLN